MDFSSTEIVGAKLCKTAPDRSIFAASFGCVEETCFDGAALNFSKEMKLRLAIALTMLAALSRLLPHPDNFTPISAMALFGAAYFSQQVRMLTVPFLALFLSDLILNNVIYRQYYPEFTFITSWWIYVAFGLVMLMGWALLRQRVTPTRLLFASLSASAVFFLVTNFSTWLDSGMYPHTPAGLTACYVAGLPFLKNTILGDLFFSGVMFGAYEWMVGRQRAAMG